MLAIGIGLLVLGYAVAYAGFSGIDSLIPNGKLTKQTVISVLGLTTLGNLNPFTNAPTATNPAGPGTTTASDTAGVAVPSALQLSGTPATTQIAYVPYTIGTQLNQSGTSSGGSSGSGGSGTQNTSPGGGGSGSGGTTGTGPTVNA